MPHPKIEDAPGLKWRQRKSGRWFALWICRRDKVEAGFKPTTVTLWSGEWPSEVDVLKIQSECQRLQGQMHNWGAAMHDAPPRTITELSRAYQTDPDGGFASLRYRTRNIYVGNLAQLECTVGNRVLSELNGRDFRRWFEAWKTPKAEGLPERIYRAHALITMLRILVNYGVAFDVSADDCARLAVMLSKMQFEQGSPRTVAITLEQVNQVRARAHAAGWHSIALAQALQFELTMRQKDVIGEWVPVSEPGVSDVVHNGYKWLYGMRWEEIDRDMILRHPMSKSRKTSKPKILEFDLKVYPMVMEELQHVPVDRRSGPVILQDHTGRPWRSNRFSMHWREIATDVGIPISVRNMDSRSGGITEATNADSSYDGLEAARHHAGHSDIRTTQRYSRGGLEKRSKIAILRVKSRDRPA